MTQTSLPRLAANASTREPSLDRARVLMIIPNLGVGGAQRVFHDHGTAFANWYDVTEVVFNQADGIAYPTGNTLFDLEVKGSSNPAVKAIMFTLRVLKASQVKRIVRPRLSISHLEGAHYINVLSRHRDKILFVAHGSIRGNASVRGVIGWLRNRILIPAAMKRADKIVVVSRDLLPEIESMGVDREKITVINNFFDIDRIEQLSAERVPSELDAAFGGSPLIITVGRLHEQKNQSALLKVMEGFKGEPIRLMIVGDGPLRSELVSLSRQFGLETWAAWEGGNPPGGAQVIFAGAQANPFAFIARADLFAFPSAWEGFPLALCEAMVCGVPVVASDCPTGPREILETTSIGPGGTSGTGEDDACGILLPIPQVNSETSIYAWRSALRNLLGDHEAREALSMRARYRVRRYSRQRILAEWHSLIAHMINTDAAQEANVS